MFMRSVKIKNKDSASTLKCEISIKFRIFTNLPALEIFLPEPEFFPGVRVFWPELEVKNPEFAQH
jgi:hypothetical protein